MERVSKSIKRAFRYIVRVLGNKRNIMIIVFGAFIAYQIKKLPRSVASSDFVEMFNSGKIREITNFNDNFIIFKDIQNTYNSSYHNLRATEKFYIDIKKMGLKFENFYDMPALLLNPFNQLYASSMIFGIMMKDYIFDFFNQKSKNYSTKKNRNINIFENFVARDEIMDNLKMIVDQLKNPEIYKERNIKPIKGVLLYGKPGTGKTLIAKCLENLQDITFIPSCASEFVEVYVGTGPKRVKELFALARDYKPAIIFIDELESIGVQRSKISSNYTNNIERYSTLNQLLSEMDGLNDMEGVVVIAATNREDLLDSALIRPGRFDKKICIELPDLEARKQIYELYINKKGSNNISSSLVNELASQSVDFSGAEIENVVNEAYRKCYSQGRKEMCENDLSKAFQECRIEHQKFKQYEYMNQH